MNSIGPSTGTMGTQNAASLILGSRDESRSQEIRGLDLLMKDYDSRLQSLEKKGDELAAVSKRIKAGCSKESSKKRNIIIGAALIAAGGVAAVAGAAAIPLAIMVKPLILGALAGEAGMLIAFNKSHNMEGALASEKISIDIRLEENEFQKNHCRRNLDSLRESLAKINEEDRKKLDEALKNMPPQSLEQLQVEDLGDTIVIAGMKLRKKS